jgi:NAD(P)-dependent dehydrogenase (short-subunit alcohol dehydrogenase family)
MRLSLVTGGSRGIGLCTARRLAARGDRVVATGTDPEALAAIADDRIEPLALDVSDRDAVAREVAALGPIHTLVLSAGICEVAGVDEDDPDDEVWRRTMAINLDGVYYTVRAAVPAMAEGGRIVVVSSGLGKLGRPRYGAYCASKHAVLGLVKCWSKELAPRKITVNAVCPGWVDTRMARGDVVRTAAHLGTSGDQFFDDAVSRIAIGRFVDADEVASLIAYLASDEAAALTGEAYNISGGEFFA